jgi:hypothetical protein
VTATITGAVEPGQPIVSGDCMRFYAMVTFVTGVSRPLDCVRGFLGRGRQVWWKCAVNEENNVRNWGASTHDGSSVCGETMLD